jgi:hypothetical protein
LLDTHRAHSNEPVLQEQLATRTFNIGFRLGALERSVEAIAVYTIAGALWRRPELSLRELAAMAKSRSRISAGLESRSDLKFAVGAA